MTELTSVHRVVRVTLGSHLAHDAQGVVEVAVDGHHARPGGLGLEQLAGRDLALGQDDHDLDTGGWRA